MVAPHTNSCIILLKVSLTGIGVGGGKSEHPPPWAENWIVANGDRVYKFLNAL